MKYLLSLVFIFVFAFTAFAQTENTTKATTKNKAVVYVYAPSATTTLVRVSKPVFLDDKEIADVRPEKYFIALVDPGKHSFRMKNKKYGGIVMDFEAGKTYYIRVNWSTGNIVRPTSMSKIETESGEFDIKQLSPVKAENIKEKSIAFTVLPN